MSRYETLVQSSIAAQRLPALVSSSAPFRKSLGTSSWLEELVFVSGRLRFWRHRCRLLSRDFRALQGVGLQDGISL